MAAGKSSSALRSAWSPASTALSARSSMVSTVCIVVIGAPGPVVSCPRAGGWEFREFPSWLIIQYVPDFHGQIGGRERLGDQQHALVQPAMVNNRISRIAGGEENLQLGAHLPRLFRNLG